MIVFSAFTPHSPLLLETISKERFHDFDDTLSGLSDLEQSLLASKPDVIVTLSSHNHFHETAFSINLNDRYTISFSEFGDRATTKQFVPDLELITQIQRRMRSEDFQFTLDSNPLLDHGSGIPLYLLTKELSTKIVPISYSGLDVKSHIAFGRILKDLFSHSSKRIAVIASGDLSHSLSSTAPMGFKKEGQQFDDAILEAVRNVSSAKLLTIPHHVVQESSECAYRPLLILFGMLERMHVRPDIRSYEAPNGVGYLVVEFHHALV